MYCLWYSNYSQAWLCNNNYNKVFLKTANDYVHVHVYYTTVHVHVSVYTTVYVSLQYILSTALEFIQDLVQF